MFVAPFVLGLAGCSEKSAVEERSRVSSPEGTTTVTRETKVESSGKNPPAPSTPSGTSTPR
jgi:hypothetical protein